MNSTKEMTGTTSPDKEVRDKKIPREETSKAIKLGAAGASAYIVCYYMRNLLGVATPGMLQTHVITKELAGVLSSVYMISYAVGQLINGTIGDRFKPKYMVSLGLMVSGLVSIFFTVAPRGFLQILCFLLIGFSLSMLRGPLVKMVSENTLPVYAQRCCACLSFSSFAGPMVASFFAVIFNWKNIFRVAGGLTLCIGVVIYFILSTLERKKLIAYHKPEKNEMVFKNLFKVFGLRQFIFYMILSGIVEMATTSIYFWIPTYLTEQMSFTPEASSVWFSVITTIRACAPFLSLLVLKLFKEQEMRMMKWSFVTATAMFTGMIFVHNRYANMLVLLLALMSVGMVSSLIWNIYIPSQRDSGMVSTVNGVLDFSGYVICFISNLLFTYTMSYVGWSGIILMWAGFMVAGLLAACIAHAKEKRRSLQA